MTRLLVVRHGPSEWALRGRWQGWADPPLSAEGAELARRAAGRLDSFSAPIVASDLLRASQTAAIMAEALGLPPPTLDPQLREIDVGDWTGLTRAEIEERWPGALEAWRSGSLARAEGGEDRGAFLARIVRALEGWAEEAPGGEVLVVTHSGAIRALERDLGEDARAPVPFLGGRWLESGDGLSVASARLTLTDE